MDDSATLIKVGETTPITWQARDDGPYESNQRLASNQGQFGEDIITELVQYITVADTQPPLLVPPAGFARESDTAIDLTACTGCARNRPPLCHCLAGARCNR